METTVAAVPVRTYPEKLHCGEATCSKCGAPVPQMERVIPATAQLRRSLTRLESANRNKNLVNSPRLGDLFHNFKSALDGVNAEVKKEQYAAKDDLRAAMDRVIREL